MAAFGVALHGPAGHYWYRLLDSYVLPNRASSPGAIVAKMVLDQALFAPFFTAVFYATLTALEGRPDAIVDVRVGRDQEIESEGLAAARQGRPWCDFSP